MEPEQRQSAAAAEEAARQKPAAAAAAIWESKLRSASEENSPGKKKQTNNNQTANEMALAPTTGIQEYTAQSATFFPGTTSCGTRVELPCEIQRLPCGGE
jgi:hypothetical protein